MQLTELRGRTIDHFQVESLIGTGGMGVVYRAEDLLLHRPVALKVMRAEHVSDERRRARFLREARTAASLVHPNIATIYEVGEAEGTIFIAMELVPGESLRAALARGKPERARALRWVVGIARALAKAHQAGVVHRDLKPDNVIVMPDDDVKLLDFGIAKALADDVTEGRPTGIEATAEQMTLDGAVMGTPQYASPEQARGEAVDLRSDVFSFGVLTFEVLAGESPFLRSTVVNTLSAIVCDPVPLLRELEPDVPPAVEAFVTRCLAKEPEERYASGAELLAALNNVIEGAAPVSGAPTSRPESVTAPTPTDARTRMSGPAESGVEQAGPPTAGGMRRGGLAVALAALTAIGVAGGGTLILRRPSASFPRAAGNDSEGAPRGTCTASRACVEEHAGEPWLCRATDHSCVAIASEDCEALYEPRDLASDDTVWLGAMFPLKGPAATVFGSMNLAGTDFARKELAHATRAIEGAVRERPVALVACDDSVDSMRAARHLVNDLGVPAILGFQSGEEIIETSGGLLVPKRVLAIASLSTNPLITNLPQPREEPRLVWRTTFSLAGLARATARFVHDVLEPRLHGAGPVRVVVVRPDRVGAASFADSLYRNLVFNGKTALENGHDYEEIFFDEAHPEDERERIAARVLALEATFVISMVLPKATAARVEEQWKGARHPTYLLVSDDTTSMNSLIGASAERRHRVFSVTSLSNSTSNARFVIRYNEAHPEHVTREFNPGSSYDAFYLLAYAAFALGERPVTGPAIARAFTELLPPGRPVEVGPTTVFDALSALSRGESIDLRGTQSALDFDPETGEAPVDFALLCPDVDASGRASGSLESGVVFDSGEGRTLGTLHCP